MIKNLYVIKDDFTGAQNVLVFENDEEAKRAFRIMANDKNSLVNMSAEDFSLWKVGEMDMKECVIVDTADTKIENAKSVRKETNEI